MATLATPSPFQLYIPEFVWRQLELKLSLDIYFLSDEEVPNNLLVKNFGFSNEAADDFFRIVNQLLKRRLPHSVSYIGG